jgi:hypothetical protein
LDAVATGSAERDVTQDLKGALTTAIPTHFSAITAPKQAGALMRSIFDYNGHTYTVAALKLPPLLFVRSGELRAAEWIEIDLETAEWHIPECPTGLPVSRQSDTLKGLPYARDRFERQE